MRLVLLEGKPTIINADSTGYYKVTPLGVGENSIVAITDGYNPEREVVEVSSNIISRRDFSLRDMADFYGYIAGFVLDEENNPLDADIIINKTQAGTFRLSHNAVNGGYGTGFNPGIYDLNITAKGFKTHIEPVELKIGEILIKNIILEKV